MLATHQTRKLREVVAFARDNSPFYRERLVGVTDEVIAALHPGNLRDLPFTTKDDLRRAQFDMLSRPHLRRRGSSTKPPAPLVLRHRVHVPM
nr:hypothetical protein [Salinispora arenicola]